MSLVRTTPPYRDNAGSAKQFSAQKSAAECAQGVTVRLPARAGERCLPLCQGSLPSKEEKGKQQPANFSSLFPQCQVPNQERLTQTSSHATSAQTFSWRQTQLLWMETASAATASWVGKCQSFSPILPRAWRSILTFNEFLPPYYPQCALVYGVLFNLLFSTSPEEVNLASYLSQHQEGL